MSLNANKKPSKASFEEICIDYLDKGIKPTKAVEMAFKDYNNEGGILSLRQAWRKYSKIKGHKIRNN